VKRADRVGGDNGSDLIVRLWESCGDRSVVTVRTRDTLRHAERCNALEEPLENPDDDLEVTDGTVTVRLNPFELVTLRLRA
jgi:alpha-mannosidase